MGGAVYVVKYTLKSEKNATVPGGIKFEVAEKFDDQATGTRIFFFLIHVFFCWRWNWIHPAS